MPSIESVILGALILVNTVLFCRYGPVLANLGVKITLEVYREDLLIAARGLSPWEIGYRGDLVGDGKVEKKWIAEAIALAKLRGCVAQAAEFSNAKYCVWGPPTDLVIRVNLS